MTAWTTSSAGVPPARRVAIARVVDIEGSGPREPGAAMAVNSDGEVAGSVSGGCVEGAVVSEALAILARRGRAADHHVRLQRRRGVRRRPDVWRHDPPVRRAARLVSRLDDVDLRAAARPASAPSEPVALATVIDGPHVGAKLLVDHRRRAARRRSATPSSTASSPATRSPSWRPAAAGSATTARGRDHAGGPRRHADRAGLRRELGAAAADVDLRCRRLHRRAGQGGQGARLPGHRLRRPRDLRHPAPLPDGRRGRRDVAGPAVRPKRGATLEPARRGVHPDPRSQVRRARQCRARSTPRSATSA